MRRASRGGAPKLALALTWAPALALAACADTGGDPRPLYRAPALSNEIDGVVFEAGNWTPHLAAGEEGFSWGNHRAVVELDPGLDTARAVRVTIPWRRRDLRPGSKAVVVLNGATDTPVANALALRVDNVSGEVVFQPTPGSAAYHVYYLPWRSTGGYYPTVTYPPELAPTPDPAWAAQVRRSASRLPSARATHIQSIDDFHSFFPMEVIATPDEEAAFMEGAPNGWRAVAEHRDRPVRMRHFIPRHWAYGGGGGAGSGGAAAQAAEPGAAEIAGTATDAAGASGASPPAQAPDRETFRSRVLRDEAFTFQVALVAGEAPLEDVSVRFDGFPEGWNWRCLTCGGVDQNGQTFRRTVTVPRGEVRSLWMTVRVPADQGPGPVEGSVTVSTASRGAKTLPVTLTVREGWAEDGGENEPDLMTRLAWLDGKAGSDPDRIVPPFVPVRRTDATLSILGRQVELAPSGLPNAIESAFTPELTGFAPDPAPILVRPLALEVVVEGEPRPFTPRSLDVRETSPARTEWTGRNVAPGFDLVVEGALEYDGMLDYRLILVAREEVRVDDIALPVAYHPEAATYMLGLGRMGGRRPESVEWRWAVENHQEGVWLGDVERGLQYVLRDESYRRPLNTNFYRNQPLLMPDSWFNGGRGGISIREEEGAVVARNYSGPRTLAAGDTLHFNVRFLITPFKPVDLRTHFETRFVHQYVPVDSVAAWGGTVVNIHHANEINPYINYPFFNLEGQKAYIDEAHGKGIKVKLYNTIRELTYRAHELFALRSLDDEILNDGEGGGHSWLQEHLEEGYHSAWHAWRVDDAAILDKGTSRWTNYYVAGLEWLARNQEIDGLYLDDIAFSRATVKRLVNVLHAHRDEVVIDLHSANQFNVRDGWINSAMLYMEHFPYVSRLWFGEYFDYGQGPDYWMTEVAGLPFGLMGEMLQDGGHPYRGMLYGMTARKYGTVDPRPVWAMMNDFGIAESRMLGYWLDEAPVRTGNPRILATTYVRSGRVLLALASWSEDDEVVDLSLDLQALGLTAGARARAPAVEGLQPGGEVALDAVRVPAGMGLWVVVEE
ncbi:MAG: hypothetical protein JSU98_05285 [Gemmatimonadales bacterium]|nr:MAG: hypothetical protein JSU98_05285 [Gemmatimonadales bacterium]